MKLVPLLLLISLNAQALTWMVLDDEFDKAGRQYVSVYISESIDEDDILEFEKITKKIKSNNYRLTKDSIILKDNLGGNIYSAMEIGKIIRKMGWSTWVPRDKYCMSACMHILVSGVCRMAEGDIYIHRKILPEIDKKPLSQEYISNTRRWEGAYFKSMDVDPILEWKIHGNPHWKGRYLSESEKLDLGLYGTIETVENNRFNEVAKEKGVKKKDLMNSLNDKFYKMNPEPNFLVKFLSNLFPENFRSYYQAKYPTCSEQLYLQD
jgi:hypothetical protein